MKTENRKFIKGILFGALAGGALSLLDREVRKSVVDCVKNTSSNVSYYIKNPNVVVDQVKDATQKIKSTFEQINEDVAFIVEKVEELQELTPELVDTVKDTQEAFDEEDEELK